MHARPSLYPTVFAFNSIAAAAAFYVRFFTFMIDTLDTHTFTHTYSFRAKNDIFGVSMNECPKIFQC